LRQVFKGAISTVFPGEMYMGLFQDPRKHSSKPLRDHPQIVTTI